MMMDSEVCWGLGRKREVKAKEEGTLENKGEMGG